jgi:signal transduction histidine kinase
MNIFNKHPIANHMRRITFIIILLITTILVQSQSRRIDSLRQLLQTGKEDTSRVVVLRNLARAYLNLKPDSTLLFASEGLSLARKINFKRGEATCLIGIAQVFSLSGNYPRSLALFLQALKIAEEIKDKNLETTALSSLADLYFYSGDINRSINYSYKAMESNRKLGRMSNLYQNMLNLGDTYENIGQLDSALFFTKEAYNYSIENNFQDFFGIVLANLGNIYNKRDRVDSAMIFYNSAKPYLTDGGNDQGLSEVYLGMAKLFLKSGQKDSCLHYAKLAFSIAKGGGFMDAGMEASHFLADYYRSVRNVDSAYTYQSATIAAKDSLFSQQKANEIQSMSYEETMRQQQIQEDKDKARAQIRQNALMGGLGTLLIVAFLLFRNNRQKKKANSLLQKQKEQIDAKAHELEAQKEILEQSYSNVELLGEIGRKITSSLSVETIISTVYDNVNSLMDAAVFGIGIYHEDSKTIDFPATYENGQALPAYSNSIYDQNRFAGLCFISGKEILMSDLSTEYNKHLQHLPNPIAGDQPASLIYIPLKVKEKTLGVITVQSFKKNAFSEYQLYMLRNIAVYAAIALENAESFKHLNVTLDRLQKTQKQLVQSEKMASLGELTAGIAHEIQNPLNFVNNFSEVNEELLTEMKDEMSKGKIDVALALANDAIENQKKINHHGKRADAIVKGMLQHTRSSSGIKEPTNINALADEYLRLAYHGLRAKDKSFNATLQTDFDESIGNINIIPQDIGRVILNLINNAFYALDEKKKHIQNGYEPTVSVSTKKVADKVLISVKDNGNGIPQKILDKIFQPFFTTKPTGQGTGLGLSLSYDIVRSHGGEIKANTKDGEGSEFIIQLPVV